MKLLAKGKDGGPESTVTGYWLIEAKGLFSIALLRFDNGSRDVYHNHAFNAISWLLWGYLYEELVEKLEHPFGINYYPSIVPIITKRDRFHMVQSVGTSWVLTFRGPWHDMWAEYNPKTGENPILTHGRRVID